LLILGWDDQVGGLTVRLVMVEERAFGMVEP